MKILYVNIFIGTLIIFASIIGFSFGINWIDKAWNMVNIQLIYGDALIDVSPFGISYAASSLYNKGYVLVYFGFVGMFFGIYFLLANLFKKFADNRR